MNDAFLNSPIDLRVQGEILSYCKAEMGELVVCLQFAAVDGDGGSVLDTMTQYVGLLQIGSQIEFLTGL